MQERAAELAAARALERESLERDLAQESGNAPAVPSQ